MDSFEQARERMIRLDIKTRGITDPAVLAAFREVPREEFVWDVDRPKAYEDRPLRIGCDQTISQPYMVAIMTQEIAAGPEHRVLEIGTGSGYQTAILAELAREVFTIERHAELADSARERLIDGFGYTNIHFRTGDGTLGWPEEAPFDRIVVTAGAPAVPESLAAQLAPGGRLVIPVGKEKNQILQIIDREGEKLVEREGTACRFVKLLGEEGWDE